MPPIDFALLMSAAVALVAVLAARLGDRLGLPALLLFLLLGMLLGNTTFGIGFNDASLAHGLGFAALAMILAEGGLTTKWENIRPNIGLAGLLATLGIAVGIGLMTLFGHLVLGLPWLLAVLLGAVTAPTDSAAVFSVLRGIPLPARLKATLEGESGLNDAPTVLVVAAATSMGLGQQPDGGIAGLIGIIVIELVGGMALGLLVGAIGGLTLRRVALPSSGLYPMATVSWALLAYGLGVLFHVSGFAAVYLAALVLGNVGLPHRMATRSFAEGVGWIAQIGLFVMLGLISHPERLTLGEVGAGVLAGLFLTVVARPLSVMACAAPFRIPWREQVFLSWAGLRGAVPIVLATEPLARGLPGAEMVFDIVLVFVVVYTSIQGPTLGWLGRRLGLVDPRGVTDVDIEVAPLDKIQADLLHIRIPDESRLHGVRIAELRLPRNAVVALIVRGDLSFAPSEDETLQRGDVLLIVSPVKVRAKVEARLTEAGRGGRLARWLGVRVD